MAEATAGRGNARLPDAPLTAQAFTGAGIKLVNLSGISTLLEVAHARGDITGEEEEAVREWLRRGPVIATRVDAEHP